GDNCVNTENQSDSSIDGVFNDGIPGNERPVFQIDIANKGPAPTVDIVPIINIVPVTEVEPTDPCIENQLDIHMTSVPNIDIPGNKKLVFQTELVNEGITPEIDIIPVTEVELA
ncbi:hypothetical protein Dimus_032151, partial [Dionaea muscipula]